jgi:hypothetical protein
MSVRVKCPSSSEERDSREIRRADVLDGLAVVGGPTGAICSPAPSCNWRPEVTEGRGVSPGLHSTGTGLSEIGSGLRICGRSPSRLRVGESPS